MRSRAIIFALDICAAASVGSDSLLEVQETTVFAQQTPFFICISKKPEVYPGADRSSIMAVLPHRPGSLCMVLNKVSEVGFNLSKLESRPIPDRDFEFMFYFDFEASVYDEKFTDVIMDLENFCEKFEYLGSYTETI